MHFLITVRPSPAPWSWALHRTGLLRWYVYGLCHSFSPGHIVRRTTRCLFCRVICSKSFTLFVDNKNTISGSMIKRFIKKVSYVGTCTAFVVHLHLHVQCLWFISTYMYSVVHFHLRVQCLWFISSLVYSVCGSFSLTCTMFVVHFQLRVQCLWFIFTRSDCL